MSEALVDAGEAPGPLAPGARLRQAREAAGLDVAEAARLLRLGERQVLALEQGDWAGLPGTTFVRGFVRNYARILQLDPAPLLADLDGMLTVVEPRIDLPTSTHVTMPTRRRSPRWGLIIALLLLLVSLALYLFFPQGYSLQSLLAPSGLTQAPGASTQAPIPVPPVTDGAPMPSAVVEPPPAAAVPTESTALAVQPLPYGVSPPVPAAPVTVPVEPQVQGSSVPGSLVFRFERDSWLEVRDRDGNLLVSRLLPAGSTKEVSGMPPLAVVVGNASHVQLQYKGRTVVLEPRSDGDVARLTLE